MLWIIGEFHGSRPKSLNEDDINEFDVNFYIYEYMFYIRKISPYTSKMEPPAKNLKSRWGPIVQVYKNSWEDLVQFRWDS